MNQSIKSLMGPARQFGINPRQLIGMLKGGGDDASEENQSEEGEESLAESEE